MGRASTEQAAAVEVMCELVMNRTFTPAEVERMLMEAVQAMSPRMLDDLVNSNTRFADLMEAEVAGM